MSPIELYLSVRILNLDSRHVDSHLYTFVVNLTTKTVMAASTGARFSTSQMSSGVAGLVTREYLPTLQFRQKWHQSARNLEVGDTVILSDEKLPRNTWHLGRVIETYPSSDGLVLSVKVKTKSADNVTT